jgi:hypothetical protein
MATSQLLDFSNWASQNVSRQSCSATNFTDASDPATHNKNTIVNNEAAVYCNLVSSTVKDAEEINLYGRIWLDDTGATNQSSAVAIYVIGTTSNRGVGIGVNFNSGNWNRLISVGGWADGARCSALPGGMITIKDPGGVVFDTWMWFKLYKDKNHVWKCYYNMSGSATKPTSWTYVGVSGDQTLDLGTLVEFGASSYGYVSAGTMNVKVDDIEIEIANEDKSALAGFTASVGAAIKSVYSLWGTNARGSARIVIGDQENALASTIQGDLGKLITLDNPFIENQD